MIKSLSVSPRKSSFESGLSLVELMVAVAILSILATIAVPAFEDMVAHSRLSSQTNELVGAIQAARGEAIKRNQQIRFCRTSSATSNDCAGAGNWRFWIVVNPNDTVLRRGNILRDGAGEPLLILTSTLDQGRLTFSPDGTTSITAGNDLITVCSPTGKGNNIRDITVGLVGRTSIERREESCV